MNPSLCMGVACASAALSLGGISPSLVRAGVCPAEALGRGLVCDGVDDYAVVQNDPVMPMGNAAYTVELWVKMTRRGNYPSGGQIYNGFIFSRGSEGPYQLQTIVGINGNIGLTHWLSDTDTGVPLPLNTWTHIATSYDGFRELLYVNGVLAWSGTIPGGLNVQGGSVTLGKHDNFNAFHFAGEIDEVRVWSSVRSAMEIAANFRGLVAPNSVGLVGYWRFDEIAGTTAFDSASGHDATLVNGAGRAPFVCCPADFDDGSGTGTPDGGVTIDDLLHYISLFADGVARADVDDGTGTGIPDGGVTIDDLLFFLQRFDAGC